MVNGKRHVIRDNDAINRQLNLLFVLLVCSIYHDPDHVCKDSSRQVYAWQTSTEHLGTSNLVENDTRGEVTHYFDIVSSYSDSQKTEEEI